MTDVPEAAGASGATPGAVLAGARVAAGLTTADVAAQMRISLRQVEAIEADRYDQLPGAVFVRGFVRNYARLLNLDPLPLLHALEPALGSEVALRAQHFSGALPESSRRGHTRLWIGFFVVLVVVVLGAAAYEYLRSRASDAAPAVPAGAAAPVPKASVDVPAEPPRSPGTQSEPVPLTPERISQQGPEPGAAAGSPGTNAAAEPSPVAPVPAAAGSAASPRMVRLELVFVAESWVEVRDKEGKVILSMTGVPNSTRAVDGMPPLAVTIGNASGVRITYNQKPIDVTANASRNIARFTLE